jgi:ABC-2 type transport system ATP-binding protein
MAPAVEVRGLARRYGSLEAVSGISFDVEAGQVLGFIGANGAGKTTTMRMIATLETPDAGSVRVCGFDAAIEPRRVRERIGWMPDEVGAYEHVTVLEYLDFYARAYGYCGRERRSRVDEVLAFTDLTEIASREMKGLSKGMAQRLGLCRALLHDPEVLVLDEPAAGLDPKARIEFKRFVRLLAQDGKTLFISSHILSELEEMCDALLFIEAGRIVHHGSAASLKGEATDVAVVEVRVARSPEALRDWALATPGVEIMDPVPSGFRLRLEPGSPGDRARYLEMLVRAGVPVSDYRREERRLEDAFVAALERNGTPS